MVTNWVGLQSSKCAKVIIDSVTSFEVYLLLHNFRREAIPKSGSNHPFTAEMTL